MGFHINNDFSDMNPFGSCRWASRIHSPGLRDISARSTRAAECFCSWLDFLKETYLVEAAPPRWKGLRAAELSYVGGQPHCTGHLWCRGGNGRNGRTGDSRKGMTMVGWRDHSVGWGRRAGQSKSEICGGLESSFYHIKDCLKFLCFRWSRSVLRFTV